jgi:arsenate reductase
MIQVFHNARCGKSRACLAFLAESELEYEVVNYLVNTPTVEELKVVIKKLGIKPIALIRQKEPIWISKYKGLELSDVQIIRAMVENPILIERPIVINGDKAVIARPFEKASTII